MSGQASLWRIYFRCHIHIFTPALRTSVSRSGRSLWLNSSCQLKILQYRAFSSKGLRTDETAARHTVPTPGGQQTENAGKPEDGQRGRHGSLVADSIANLDAMSFLASAGSREKKFVETESEDSLLAPGAEKADRQFLKNYKLLLSDANYDLGNGLQDLEDSKWVTEDPKRQSEGFRRMPMIGNHRSVGQFIAREPQSCIISHIE